MTSRFAATRDRFCAMCGRNLTKHPACEGCSILLEPELTRSTLCRCGRYHNAPSDRYPSYCRSCKQETPLTGKPEGEPPTVEDGEETNEYLNDLNAKV